MTRDSETRLLEIDEVSVEFRTGGTFTLHRSTIQAVQSVSVQMTDGHALGVVGESGSGKSTLGRCVLGLQKPTSGTVRIEGTSIVELLRDHKGLYRKVQAVFQDPMASLNPTMSIGDILAEPLRNLGGGLSAREIEARTHDLLDHVRLPRTVLARRPRGLSGGQRQRVSIARALAPQPRLIVLDEALSALDVATQAQVINLLADLRDETGVSYFFISHDLAVVRHLCDDLIVMQGGRVVESGATLDVCDRPQDDYTRSLIDAVPVPDPTVKRIRRG